MAQAMAYLSSPGLRSPFLWGTDERLQELWGDRWKSLQITPRTMVFRNRSAQHWLDVWRTYFGPLGKPLRGWTHPVRRRWPPTSWRSCTG